MQCIIHGMPIFVRSNRVDVRPRGAIRLLLLYVGRDCVGHFLCSVCFSTQTCNVQVLTFYREEGILSFCSLLCFIDGFHRCDWVVSSLINTFSFFRRFVHRSYLTYLSRMKRCFLLAQIKLVQSFFFFFSIFSPLCTNNPQRR